ncbi:MAG TPA: flagellar biosynthesis protein FlhB [Candidatus Brocadiia bacterium]|nr:flagellar biosynthesis protein FlhB [Candidatus Brocadiia bacterium]
MSEDAEDKTEPATPKRRDDARRRGQVCKSAEVPIAVILCAALITLSATGKDILTNLAVMLRRCLLIVPPGELTNAQTLSLVGGVWWSAFMAFLPLLATVFIAAFAALAIQIGVHYNDETLMFRPERLNPATGLTNLVSLQSVARLLVSLAKLSAIIITCWVSIKDEMATIMPLACATPAQFTSATSQAIFAMSVRVAVVMAIIAFADWCYQKWQFEKNMRMSKQEIKDEAKMLEGDPKIKARIRQIQFQMAKKRMLSKVPQAGVVIRNPTHFAVALQYNKLKNSAPIVVAKGADHLARKILDIAFQHRIPIVTDPPLARALYHTVDLDQEIPLTFYKAVARILARLYRQKRRAAAVA